MTWGDDLGGDDETLLAQQYDRPVFVFNYPKGVKAFYMKENPDDPRTVLNNDCLAPEGYGEIIGGSQREDDYDKLLARIQEQGLDPEAYRWYLDLRKYGTFVHSGFGLGRGADRGLDLRHPAHSRDHRLSATNPPALSLIGRRLGRRFRLSLPFSRSLFSRSPFHFVPQPIQHLQPRGRDVDPAFGGQPLDRLETGFELPIGAVERRSRLHAGFSRQVHHREEAGRRSPRSARRWEPAPRWARGPDCAAPAPPPSSSSRTLPSGPPTSGQSKPTPAARSCSR